MVYVKAQKETEDGVEVQKYDYNEYAQIQRCVYRTSAEIALRMQGFPTVMLSHTVTELTVHGLDGQSIAFVEGHEDQALDDYVEGKKRSKLVAFFDLCRAYLQRTGQRLHITYPNVGFDHWFDDHKEERCWVRRQRRIENLLSRVLSVSSRNPELYALRLLLFHVKGPTGFDDLASVEQPSGVRRYFDSFTAAAQHFGLLEDTAVWVLSIIEAAREYSNPKRCRLHMLA